MSFLIHLELCHLQFRFALGYDRHQFQSFAARAITVSIGSAIFLSLFSLILIREKL